jgi:glycosyltransferase involved in cell wall biosynthesis
MLSITAPLYNEEESVAPLIEAVRIAMRGYQEDWELVLVDDGSQDGTVATVEAAMQQESRVRLVRLARNYGQSAAMQAGFDHCRGDVIVTMDGDLQNDPADIPALVARLAEGFDVVAGYRVNRQDRLLSRRLPSRLANRLLQWATGVAIRDTGCSLKAFRREVVEHLRLYSDLHRFIPSLAAAVAGARITEMPVRHHPRRFGQSKYGLSRVGKVLADLITLVMLRRFREHPLRMFSLAGLMAFLLALAASVGALLAVTGMRAEWSTTVLSAIAVTWFSLGGFLTLVGLIAERILNESAATVPFHGKLLHRVGP